MPPSPSPGRFRQADAILDAALDLEGEERIAFVERACEGNPALKSMVQRLLRALEHSSDFLSASAVEVARPLLDVVTAPGGEQEALPPPEQVGPYRVLRELGRGGMGVVYLATRDDDSSGSLVALKTLRGGALATGTLLRRFLSERRILATLNHPFIARLHESGITPAGEPYFAMAYCAGDSLAERVAHGPVPVSEALRVARQLAEALSAAHAVGIIHRDIKPANVLFTGTGDVQLTDFGELIGALGKVRSLRVTARTTAFALKRRGLDPRAIANVLGVTHVLEGTVRRSGDRIKVTVQLVQAIEGTIAWTETYDRMVEDIFDLQEKLAAAIVAELALTLAPSEPNTTTPPQLDLAAYDLYLKGRFFAEKRTARGLERAVEYFGRAVERNPEYAEAHAGLADAYIMLAAVCNRRPGECIPLARAAIAEALRIGNGLANVHATHGNLLSAFEWEWEEAERELRKAMELAPAHIAARLYLAIQLQHLGRCDEAIELASQALTQDPLSPALNLALGRAHLHAQRPAEALKPLRTAIEIAPGLRIRAPGTGSRAPGAEARRRCAVGIPARGGERRAERGGPAGVCVECAGGAGERRRGVAQPARQRGDRLPAAVRRRLRVCRPGGPRCGVRLARSRIRAAGRADELRQGGPGPRRAS